MAKKKGSKAQTKKVPQEKFVVVTNAWGVDGGGKLVDAHFNNVAAWFEIMLRDLYPGKRVSAIHYQRTHGNLIVELPREVENVGPLLGRHLYSQFLTNAPHSDRYAEIYEYRYSRHGDPGEKNWSVAFPTYRTIPPNIPLRTPYPVPTIADLPPIDVADYAYPVPGDVYAQREASLRAVAVSAAAEPKFIIEPGESRGESSSQALQSQTTSLATKTEEVDDFLASFMGPQEGPSNIPGPSGSSAIPRADPDEEDDYEPSAELLAMMAEINPLVQATEPDETPDVFVKPEPVEDELPNDYEPSAELLAMMAEINPVIQATEPHETPDVFVKPEPMEDELPDYTPSQSDELLASLSLLTGENKYNEQSAAQSSSSVRVKPEPEEFTIKPEPMDTPLNFDSPSRSPSRDIRGTTHRVKQEVKAEVKREIKLEIKSEDSGNVLRIKPEPVDDSDSWLLSLPSGSSQRVESIGGKRSGGGRVVEPVDTGLTSSLGQPSSDPRRRANPQYGHDIRGAGVKNSERRDSSFDDGDSLRPRGSRDDSGRGRGRERGTGNVHISRDASNRAREPMDSRFHAQGSQSRPRDAYSAERPDSRRVPSKRESPSPYQSSQKRIKKEYNDDE